jgi:2-oxoisovalerate dehydrogenase E1 component
MDLVAVHTAMTEALAHMRAGNGPTLIEADVYRFFHQNGLYPGSAFGYRDKSEEKAWRDRDPLAALRAHVLRRGLVTEGAIEAAREEVVTVMREIGDAILEPVPGGRRRDPRRTRPLHAVRNRRGAITSSRRCTGTP